MADSTWCQDGDTGNAASEGHPTSKSSFFATTFGNISGQLQKAVQMKTSSSASSVSSANSNHSQHNKLEMNNSVILNQDTEALNAKTDQQDDREQSETESTTTESSSGMQAGGAESVAESAASADENSLLEAKIQILYGQLHTRDETIKQLRAENYHTKQDFEVFEKESAECMEELGYDIQDLNDKLQDLNDKLQAKEDRVKELEALQINNIKPLSSIPEHLEGPEELVAELEKLSQQIKLKDDRIEQLEKVGSGVNQERSDEASPCSELRAELDLVKEKLKEKGEMLQKVEEAENLNFTLVEERDEEIERLNAKIAAMESHLEAADPNQDVDDNFVNEQRANIQLLTELINEKDQQLANQANIQSAHDKSTREIKRLRDEATQQVAELEAMKEGRIQDQEELGATIADLNDKCKQLESKVDSLSNELIIANERVDKHESEASEFKEVSAMLEKERAHTELLAKKVKTLAEELAQRKKRIGNLGFDSDTILVEALQEIDDLRRQQQSPDKQSIDSLPANVTFQEESGDGQTNEGTSEEDDGPKSIETLLIEEENLRQKLKSKVKSLTHYLQKRDFDDSSESNMDMHELYFHLAQQIKDIVVELSARDGVGKDLIKAFQLKLEYTAGIEKALKAREVQIEMLVQDMEEMERNSDNLNTSINTNSSNHSLLLSSKLEELLAERDEKDQKLSVLEWLTVDLTKTLESQSDELEEVKWDAANQKRLLERKVDRLLNDAKDRDLEVQSLKQLIESEGEVVSKYSEVKARLKQESSQREGLQEIVDSLTTSLQDAEKKIRCLEEEVESRKQDKAQREGLQAMVDSLTVDIRHAETKLMRLESAVETKDQELSSQRQEHQAVVATLRNDLNDVESSVKRLETELETKDSFIQMREAQLEELTNTDTSLQAVLKKLMALEAEKKSLDAALLKRESLVESLRLKAEGVGTLQSENCRTKEQLRERISQVVTLICVLEKKDRDNVALEHETESKDEVLDGFERDFDNLLADLKNKDQLIEELVVEKENALELVEASHQDNAKSYAAMAELREQNSTHLREWKAQEKVSQGISNRKVEELMHSHAKEKSALEQKIDALKAKQVELLEEVKSRDDKLEEASKLVSQMDKLKALNDDLLSDLKSWEARVNDLEKLVRTKDEVFNEMTVIEQLLEDQKCRTQDLLQEIDTLTNALEQKESELAHLRTEASDRSDYMADLEQKVEKLTNELETAVQARQSIEEESKGQNQELQTSLTNKEQELESMRSAMQELQRQCAEYANQKEEYDQKRETCERLESEVEALTDSLRRLKEVMEEEKETRQSSLSKETMLQEEIQTLRNETEELNDQIDKISHEKTVLVDSIATMQEKTTLAEEEQLQKQQEMFEQLSENMESVSRALDEREKQLEVREEENKLKVSFMDELQKKIDQQANDIESLMEENESNCSEMHTKLDNLTNALRESGRKVRTLEESIQQQKAAYEATKAENEQVRQQLEAIGFDNMEDLVKGLASKCQEHAGMENTIDALEREIINLRKELEQGQNKSDTAEGGGPGFRHDARGNNVAHIHKIRELEMKIGIFRDEIAGKNAIIEDLTLRLNGDIHDEHSPSLSADRFSQSSRDAPGLRMKRVAGAALSMSKQALKQNDTTPRSFPSNGFGTDDEIATITAEALATIPELIQALKERDATIDRLEKEVASSKRAIDSLSKGLEFNVQGKIEADKLVYEKQSECSKFAHKVQHLSKELKQKEKIVQKMVEENKRPMKRNLASYDEIKSLSVSELVDLLRQSRVLAEDLETERERLITNATNMSVALAESRSRVDEMMKQLGPDSSISAGDSRCNSSLASSTEPGRIRTKAKEGRAKTSSLWGLSSKNDKHRKKNSNH